MRGAGNGGIGTGGGGDGDSEFLSEDTSWSSLSSKSYSESHESETLSERGASSVSKSATRACSANWICRLLAVLQVRNRISSRPTSLRSNPRLASSSWHPGTRHSFTLTGTSTALITVSRSVRLLDAVVVANSPTTCRKRAITSSADSGLASRLAKAAQEVGDKAKMACRLALHWVNRSPGSLCGKKTADGMPLAAGSNLNPTDMSRSFQPSTLPTLFSMLFWEVYMAFL